MADSWVDDSQFDEAYEILSQENQETIEAYRNNSPSEQPINHLEQVLNVLRSLGGDVEEGLEEQRRRMDSAIERLERVTGLSQEEDQLAHDLEEEWREFVKMIDEEFQRAEGKKASSSGGGRISGFFSSEEEGDDDSEEEHNIIHYPGQLEQALEEMEQKHLNPLLRDEEEKTEQEEALKNLTQVLQSSVELHQEANKYKLILMKAKNDVRLQEDMAEHHSIDWFNQEVMEAGKQEQRLEREVETIMEVEKDLVNSFERAEELLRQILELDEDVLETINAEAGQKQGRAREFIGSLASGENDVIQMLEFIDEVHPEYNYASIAEHIDSGFRPKITQLQRMEETDVRREKSLADEVEQYIQEHRRLFRENEQELEEERESLTPEGPVEDANNGAPPGTGEFIEKIEELRELMNQGVMRDLKDAEQHYRKIYRIDHDEIENVEDFHVRAEKLADKLEYIEQAFVNDTPFKNAYEAQEGSDRLKMEMERFMNGEGRYDVGLRQVSDSIEELQADVERIYLDEKEEAKHFKKAHDDLEQEIVRIREIVSDLDDLESMVERFRDPDNPRNTINGESHPYRAYHDAFLVASRTIFEGNDKEVQIKLHDLIEQIVAWVEDLENEIERIESIIGEIVNEEHVEEEKLQREVELMEGLLENLEEAFQGDISEPIPSPISRELDDIDRAIGKLKSRLEEIEERKEGEEDELKDEGAAFDEILDETDMAEDEGKDILDETESMFSEEFDEEF